MNDMKNNPERAKLQYNWSCSEWNIGGKDEVIESEKGTIEVEIGTKINLPMFEGLKVLGLNEKSIRFNNGTILPRGEYRYFSLTVDGYEDHEGVVWEGKEYFLSLFYPE